MIFSLSYAHKVQIGQQFEDSLAIESAILKYQDVEKIQFSKGDCGLWNLQLQDF